MFRRLIVEPKLLSSDLVADARQKTLKFIENTDQSGGTRRLDQHDWFFTDPDLCKHMAAAFDDTCAYCEAEAPYLQSGDGGTVHTHRPKSSAEDPDGKTDFHAYSWLSFEWENLLWTCGHCARAKQNKFFVAKSRAKPTASIEECRDLESELVLDPFFHRPEEHLLFQLNGEVDGKTDAGHSTIQLLDLNRSQLVRRRRNNIMRLLMLLRDNPNVLTIFRSSTVEDMDFVPFMHELPEARELDTGPFGPGRFIHSGATYQALESFGRLPGYAWSGESDLGSRLGGMNAAWDDSTRSSFINAAMVEARRPLSITKSDESETFLTGGDHAAQAIVGTKPHRTKRIPDIRKLPTAQLPVSAVNINNFKALGDIAFDLPITVKDSEQTPCMILLGENATGKSSVLEAMALAVIGTEEAAALDAMLVDEDLSPADLIHRPDALKWDDPAPEMSIELVYRNADARSTLAAEAGATGFSGTGHCAKVVLGYGPRRYFTKRKTRRLRAPAHRVRSMFDPLDMIANPIHWLAKLDERPFNAAARALREILMLKYEDDFERDMDSATHREVYIWQNGQRTALKDLSVGYKSIIAMACDIVRELLYHYDNLEYAHAIVFVDEIETHLHPRWKMQIMTLLRKAFPKVQFIVTTHDPLCLRGMFDGEVFVLQRDGVNAKVETLVDLPSIRGMRAEQILTSEFFGLGSTDPETDAKLIRFNRLAARIESLSDPEIQEMEQLRKSIADHMVIGNTLAEQAYAEALKKRVDDAPVPDVIRPNRKDMRDRFSALLKEDDAS